MSTLHTLPSCFSRQWGLWWFIAVLLGSQCACQRGSGALKRGKQKSEVHTGASAGFACTWATALLLWLSPLLGLWEHAVHTGDVSCPKYESCSTRSFCLQSLLPAFPLPSIRI